MADIWQILGAGITTAIGLFLANIWLEEYRKPQLVLDKSKKSIEKRRISIKFFDTEINNRQYIRSTSYLLHRIKIINNGKSAAKNCNAILDFGYSQWKLIWKSSKKENVTINPKSFDYLDICSILLDKKEDVFHILTSDKEELEEEINKIYTPELNSNNYNISYDIRNDKEELVDFKEKINRDYPSKGHILNILLPFEDGWDHLHREYQDNYLETGSGEGNFLYDIDTKPATIIVSAENAEPLEFKIKINSFVDDKGSYIIVEDIKES